MLTAVAMAMTQLRVCPLVLNNDFRHPAVLGQDLATRDIVSDGRLDVGIGERVKRTHSRCRARC